MDCPQQREVLNAYERLYLVILKTWIASANEVKDALEECGNTVYNLIAPTQEDLTPAFKASMKSAAAKLQAILDDGRIRGTPVDPEMRNVIDMTARFLDQFV